jgi:hypothetical protein
MRPLRAGPLGRNAPAGSLATPFGPFGTRHGNQWPVRPRQVCGTVSGASWERACGAVYADLAESDGRAACARS